MYLFQARNALSRCAMLVLSLALLGGCDRFQSKPLILPPTPSITGSLGWLLVKESYARLKVEARSDSSDAGHLRDGEILEVEGREYGKGVETGSRVIWYLVKSEKGRAWVSGEDVEILASREQALRVRDEAGGK